MFKYLYKSNGFYFNVEQGKWRHNSDPTWDSFEYPSTDTTIAASTDSPITTTHTTTESDTTSDEPLHRPIKTQPAAPVAAMPSQSDPLTHPTGIPATNDTTATAIAIEPSPKPPIVASNEELRQSVVCLLLLVQG